MGAFAVRRGQALRRADVNYNLLGDEVATRLARPRYPLVPLRELEVLLQYGCSKRASEEPPGYPIIRMNNLQRHGWDLEDLKFVELTEREFQTWRLEVGDIVFNRTNSKELVGKCEVFNEDGDWVFASYLMRFRIDKTRALPEFVAAFLNTRAGRAQIDRESRQIIGMSNINAQEVRGLLVPLPEDITVQERFLSALEQSRARSRSLQQEASQLLDGVDSFVLERLGLTAPPSHDPSKPFGVRLGDVRGKRLDPPALAPFPVHENPKHVPIVDLGNIARIDVHEAPPQADDETDVPYVGLPECDLNSVREVSWRRFRDVRGRSVAHVGDILFARIEPSVFNKKYVFVDSLFGHDYAFLSTEFYSVVANGTEADQQFLYAMFHSSFVYNQVRGKTTGSSGRRRLDRDLFESLQIPWPDESIRRSIAEAVTQRRESAKRLRAEALAVWDEGRDRFESALLMEESQ